jgi:hypothetical protein
MEERKCWAQEYVQFNAWPSEGYNNTEEKKHKIWYTVMLRHGGLTAASLAAAALSEG